MHRGVGREVQGQGGVDDARRVGHGEARGEGGGDDAAAQDRIANWVLVGTRALDMTVGSDAQQ